MYNNGEHSIRWIIMYHNGEHSIRGIIMYHNGEHSIRGIIMYYNEHSIWGFVMYHKVDTAYGVSLCITMVNTAHRGSLSIIRWIRYVGDHRTLYDGYDVRGIINDDSP